MYTTCVRPGWFPVQDDTAMSYKTQGVTRAQRKTKARPNTLHMLSSTWRKNNARAPRQIWSIKTWTPHTVRAGNPFPSLYSTWCLHARHPQSMLSWEVLVWTNRIEIAAHSQHSHTPVTHPQLLAQNILGNVWWQKNPCEDTLLVLFQTAALH